MDEVAEVEATGYVAGTVASSSFSDSESEEEVEESDPEPEASASESEPEEDSELLSFLSPENLRL